ncbi:MAG: LL-diaminopimelate aminotransferase [Christensenellaceae bacterium]|jgi:LL-diaminopimelate aminotransferase|nr:LL-diaminopimelate aminotransferase [Christensenellaceae bacterium]
MVKINGNFKSLKTNYLFKNIGKKLAAFQAENPTASIIKMGIGDVTIPLCPPVTAAMAKAATEMGVKETFKGYEDNQGYDFLKSALVKYYQKRNVMLFPDEIFVGDGAKEDIANFLELFSPDNVVLIPDPVYPVYMDSNIMAGRNISLIDGNERNGFLPMPSEGLDADIIFLCSPNNPTGAVYTKEQLQEWVDFAREHKAIILFDAAYEAFISDDTLPHSIYEIEGAYEVAVEFCSLSKTAGFTGTRLGYTVVPERLKADGESLNKMWARRQGTKHNGVAYVIQRGAEAVFTEAGQKSCAETIEYYRGNAAIMAETFKYLNIWFTGGVNSPYIWLKCKKDSWAFFDELLSRAGVVGTPGSGFGKCGEGFFRLTAFNTRENTIEAMERIKRIFNRF